MFEHLGISDSLHRDVSLETLTRFPVKHSDAYSELGVFNLLLSHGDWLFTCCSTKMGAITLRSPFGPARLEGTDATVTLAKWPRQLMWPASLSTNP
jgi:glutamine amidotransferase